MQPKQNPDKTLVSVCGLFCQACGIYWSTQENNIENLERIAKRINVPFEEIRCNGCRSETRTAYCKNCYMQKCAAEKGIDFCGSCTEYPCQPLKDFQAQLPHRTELWKSQDRIREVGWETWFQEMNEYYSCSECGSLNGWYDVQCRNCGKTPGSTFVANNMDKIKAL